MKPRINPEYHTCSSSSQQLAATGHQTDAELVRLDDGRYHVRVTRRSSDGSEPVVEVITRCATGRMTRRDAISLAQHECWTRHGEWSWYDVDGRYVG